VKLANNVTLVLEIKGKVTDQDNAKREAAKRWIATINNWGELGPWAFQVNKA
jgi:type III restriction enzyme